MLQAADESKAAPLDWYATLDLARTTAAGIPDVAAALQATDRMRASFMVDDADLSAETITLLAATTRRPDERAALLSAAQDLVGRCILADRYDVAARTCKIGLVEAKKSGSVPTAKRWQTLTAQVESLARASTVAAAAAKVLEQTPDDPAANLTVGQYRCFDKGDWNAGLPLLARCGDADLRNLAERDLAGSDDPATQNRLGDAWWDLAGKHGPAAGRLRARAAFWYARAAPKLAGLERVKAEHRIKDAEATPESIATGTGARVVDLLALDAEHRTVVDGKWEMTADGLFCSRGGRLLFNYAPPEEYDLVFEFTRRTGNDSMAAICPLRHGAVSWVAGGWANHAIAFTRLINGGWFVLTAHDKDVAVRNGARYTATIRVRRDRARAFLNGELVSDLASDGTGLDAGPDHVADSAVVGIAVDVLSTAMIYKLEVTEVTGHGQMVSAK